MENNENNENKDLNSNNDELEEIKRKYRKDQNAKPKREIKMDFNMKGIMPYLIVLAAFVLTLITAFVIIDSYVMPSLVHDRPTVMIPDLEGLSITEAQKICDESNIECVIAGEQYSKEVPKETIMRQMPKPGKQVKAGRPVYLTLSKGSETVKVPYLLGKSIRDARVDLMERGLKLGKIDYEFNEVVPKDTIISQSVKSGTTLPYGEEVSIVVSKGSEKQVLVPDLTGLELSALDEFLKESGLRLGDVKYVDSETFFPGVISNQYPPAGKVVQFNSEVHVVVAK